MSRNAVTTGATVAGFNELLGIQLCGYENGVYRLELAVGQQHLHGAGSVHGGVFLALLDTVMSRSVQSDSPRVSLAPTMQLSGNFFRPLARGRIYAEGRVINRSRKTVVAEGKLFDAQHRLLAQGGAIFLVTERKPLA
ncbi:PaaI family thioesterase [Haliea alexandrii]|uniref:PaaI family thioesterase n=1 Tax=Haliea alexandrii TaxID=2448162 RepID=UPI000F0BCDF2